MRATTRLEIILDIGRAGAMNFLLQFSLFISYFGSAVVVDRKC
jgi:hypothetical protein